MNKLSEILYIEKSISEKEAIIKPIENDINKLNSRKETLVYDFLVNTLEKRKKYYLEEEYEMKWFMLTEHKFDKESVKLGHPQLFHIEYRDKAKNSIVFKDYVSTIELYNRFKNTIGFKELVRESNIKTILDD